MRANLLHIELFQGHLLSYEQIEGIHKMLVGTQDYIDSNVAYNIDGPIPTLMVDISEIKEPEVIKDKLHKIIDYMFNIPTD